MSEADDRTGQTWVYHAVAGTLTALVTHPPFRSGGMLYHPVVLLDASHDDSRVGTRANLVEEVLYPWEGASRRWRIG